ncbi:Uu.00g080380.m01.CDS01 [Anthostomella pinea]|uniref:Uu.00g080380.m01.CDS01 n=1 Tax=Anthostomella pinea TaxID=933095 RepID=A0AAI8VLN1_9PEZI|nr:Uu.00g080380.m01.CDS01 [Anthostomella pinea]
MRGLGLILTLTSCSLAPVLADAGSLGQYALQKLLQDGIEVFGDVESTDSANENWMGRLPDSMLITHINVPGTHDAATWNYSQATHDALSYATRCDGTAVPEPRAYRCQRMSFADSLRAGIRFFDLRCALDPIDANLVFWHGPALVSARATVADVLFGFYAWLEAHPSEMLILSFQYEGSTKVNATNDAAVQRALFDVLTSEAARRYVLQEKGTVGTLGGARGKILLVRRFDLADLPLEFEAAMPGLHMPPTVWTDNSSDFELVYNKTTNATAYIEDYYSPDAYLTTADNIAAKLNATRAHLEKATQAHFGSLFITFTSGTHVALDPPVFPEVMALGTGTGANGTEKRGVNQQLVPLLRHLKGSRLGIVVMDFFEEPEGLVDLVLRF